MKKLVLIFVIFCFSLAYGQQYTAVTATLTDTTGTAWANATYTIQIVAPFNNSAALQNQGVTPISPVVGTADSNGIISVSLDDNLIVKPTGSTWRFTICPNANVNNCSSSIQVVTGATLDMSSQLSANLLVPSISANPTIFRAYNDAEVFGGQGSVYIRTTDGVLRGCNIAFCNGTGWTSLGGSGGVGSSLWSSLLAPTGNLTLSMNGFTTSINMGVTGASGGAYTITDDPNNTGLGYLFSINTGTSSTANPFGVFLNGTGNGIQISNAGILSALGTGQNIATSLLNTAAGIGTFQMGSNGSGSIGQANTVKIMGNTNQLYVSENAGALTRVLIGGLGCGTSVLQSTNAAGTPTCLNILGGNNTFTGANTWGGTQAFNNVTVSGTCTGCSAGGSGTNYIEMLGGSLSNSVVNYFGNAVVVTGISAASIQMVMPRAGTINNLSCRSGGTLTGTQTYTYLVLKGAASIGSITPASTTLTCQENSTNANQCNDLNGLDGFSVAAQDVLVIQGTPGNTPTISNGNCYVTLN